MVILPPNPLATHLPKIGRLSRTSHLKRQTLASGTVRSSYCMSWHAGQDDYNITTSHINTSLHHHNITSQHHITTSTSISHHISQYQTYLERDCNLILAPSLIAPGTAGR